MIKINLYKYISIYKEYIPLSLNMRMYLFGDSVVGILDDSFIKIYEYYNKKRLFCMGEIMGCDNYLQVIK